MADKNANPPLPGNTTDGKKGVGEKAVNKRDKKGKGKLLLFIFIVVLILLIAAFLTAHLYFDLFGWKAPMFQLMHRLDPVYVELEDREATLVVGETALGEREAAVEERENSLTIKELQIQKREEELLQMEKNRVPVYRPPVNETDREYM
ncbi:MAG: hypothetical protein GX823_06370, partial [Clostridiales bacterium]|nr:hypothetical protein [Clostridiales bacterium]